MAEPRDAGAPPVVQLAYASVAASTAAPGRSTGRGGWQVLGTTGSPSPAETAVLESGVVTQFHGHVPLPEFASERDRDGALRRLAHLALADGSSALWHAVEAGTDATGRPGNVFTHAVLERAGAARRSAVRAVELWRSPLFLRPFGGREVEAARLDPQPSLLPAGVVTRERVLSFLLVEPAPVWRAGFAAVLLDAVLGALEGGPRVVLGVDDQDDAARWIGAVSFLTSAQGARTLSWSVYERASDLDGAWDRGIHLAVVPRADLVDRFGDPAVPNARAVVLDEREQPRLGQDETPHESRPGQRVPARDWSELALAVLSDPELANRATSLLDAVGAVPGGDEARIDWPLAVAAALALAEQPAHDALAPANRILAEATPRAALADPVVGALAHAAAAALLAPGDDAASAWQRLATEEARAAAAADGAGRAARGSFALDALAGDYVVRALGDDAWLLGPATPPVSRRACAPAVEADRLRALAALAALSAPRTPEPARPAEGADPGADATAADAARASGASAPDAPARAEPAVDDLRAGLDGEAPATAPVGGASEAERLARALRAVRSIDLLARAGAFGEGRSRAGAGEGPAAARELAEVLASAERAAAATGAEELVRAAAAAVERTVLPVLPTGSGALAAAAGPLGAFVRALVVRAIDAARTAPGSPALDATPAEAVVWLEGAGGDVPPAPYPGSAALVADATPFETDAAVARLRHGMLDAGVAAVAAAALLDEHGAWEAIPERLRSRLDAAAWTIDDVLALERRAPGGLPDGIVSRALATAPAAPAATAASTRAELPADVVAAPDRGRPTPADDGADGALGAPRPSAPRADVAPHPAPAPHGDGAGAGAASASHGADPWGIRLETGETPVIAEAGSAPADDPWNIAAAEETPAPEPVRGDRGRAATACDEAAFGVVGSAPAPVPADRPGAPAAAGVDDSRDDGAAGPAARPPARRFPPYAREDDERARELAELVVRGRRGEHARRLAGLRLAAFDGSIAGRMDEASRADPAGTAAAAPPSPFAVPVPGGPGVFGVPPIPAPGAALAGAGMGTAPGQDLAAEAEARARAIDAAADETATILSDMFARLRDAAHDAYDGLLVSALLVLAGADPFAPRSGDRQRALAAAATPDALADAEARQLAALDGPVDARPRNDAAAGDGARGDAPFGAPASGAVPVAAASAPDATILSARAVALAAAAHAADGAALELSPELLGVAHRVAAAAAEAGLVDETAWSTASATAHASLERALAAVQAAPIGAEPGADRRFAPRPTALPSHDRLAQALAPWHPDVRVEPAGAHGGPGGPRSPHGAGEPGPVRAPALGADGGPRDRELSAFEELGLAFDEPPHDPAAAQRPASASNQRIGFWRNRKEH